MVLLDGFDDFNHVHGWSLVLIQSSTLFPYIGREQPNDRAFELGKVIDDTNQRLHCSQSYFELVIAKLLHGVFEDFCNMRTLGNLGLFLLGFRLPVQRDCAPPSQTDGNGTANKDTPIPDYLAKFYSPH